MMKVTSNIDKYNKKKVKLLRPCSDFFSSLITHHSIFVTHYSLLITHHLKYPTRLAPSLTCYYSIFFTLFVGPIPVTRCSYFFFPVPKLIEPSEK